MSINIGTKTIIRDGLVFHVDPSITSQYILSEVEVLVVGGGGGGAGDFGNGGGQGGGGGGGVVYRPVHSVIPGSATSITVGAGGDRGLGSTQAGRSNAMHGRKGSNSSFGDLIAYGGGGGAADDADSSTTSGASGGGGGYTGTKQGGIPIEGQGNRGGNHSTYPSDSGWYSGGGGGGAGTPGEHGHSSSRSQTTNKGGRGGEGLGFWISGSYKIYGGGGGGATYNRGYGGSGGSGGGGSGGSGWPSTGTNGEDGVNGLGGGGGAGGGPSSGGNVGGNGGRGGSGVVIVRYPGPQKASGGDQIISLEGYTIHTFYSNGTFTPFNTLPTNNSTIYGLEDLSGNGNNSETERFVSPTYKSANGGYLNFNGNQRIQFHVNGEVDCKCFEYAVRYYQEIISSPNTDMAPYYAGGVSIACESIHDPYRNGFNVGSWTGGFNGETISWWTPTQINSSYGAITITDTVSLNWHIVTVNWVGDEWEIWLDGTKRITFGHSSQGPAGNMGGVYGIILGYSPGFNYYFSGDIGFARMYDRSLTDSEILHNFNLQRGRFGI